jgi:hypothetical protein
MSQNAIQPDPQVEPKTPGVLFPDLYVWFVFLSFMDVMLTHIAFNGYGAIEANPFAAWMIRLFEQWGHGSLTALTALKFTAVPIVLIICEFVGRHRYATGKKLAEWMVALAAIPIVFTFILLLTYIAYGGTPRHLILQP